MSKTTSPVPGGKKHKKCPSLARNCTCLINDPIFFQCCGYWCKNCKLHINQPRKT